MQSDNKHLWTCTSRLAQAAVGAKSGEVSKPASPGVHVTTLGTLAAFLQRSCRNAITFK